MIRLAVPALLLAAAPAIAQDAAPAEGPAAPLSMQQQAALKCSAAFALGAAEQAQGRNKAWPLLAERGKEFFVRSSAAIMDETGWTRDQVADELTAQARDLRRPGALEAAMQPCLLLLDASGL
ncbi:hypothetical protein N0B51_01090 [Tsuneonella sp. YG55]|uniref:Uncharacterized protein n=1 Tax=Tsuneonella litorea TaxID=2976475 RepID=A0A9X3ALW9_9SPHN|nr:hypothetical protein [Tsuneonella litorea]MCT2557567.1 hypothetical protein [Tsuneonella litorea]